MPSRPRKLRLRIKCADFRRIDSRTARILLLDGASRILPSFAEDLSQASAVQLEKMGVEIRTGTTVREVNERGVRLDGEFPNSPGREFVKYKISRHDLRRGDLRLSD